MLKSRDGKSRKIESLIIAMLTDQGGIGGQITCTLGYYSDFIALLVELSTMLEA